MKNKPLRIALVALLLGALGELAACQKPEPPPTAEVVLLRVPAVPDDPKDALWGQAPEHVARLVLQDLVEPRLMKPSTELVRVRALTNGTEVAFRLEWADPARNERSLPSHFSDACAVQLPAQVQPDVPAPQMGEAGRPVEITLWKAAWQASVEGRGDSIQKLYPNAAIDHYPFQAQSLEKGSAAQAEMEARYAPAVAVGNVQGASRTSAVEDLLAEGPGSLSPTAQSTSRGRGAHAAGGWSVVLVRRLPQGLQSAARSQVAFAVWEGSQDEVGARKMRTGWIPLVLQGAQP